MKNVIIGTAGHVDHGKTMLIKALTGIDTDRLQDEKTRGITIELGFAHIDFEDGTRAGIIDVPGHEKFIKNMLAGAGGIDLAMLVVAADEGFMPQTVEHMGILSLLGINDGLIVITKTDIVDPEWLAMLTDDIKEHVRGTFLEDKPILPVSAHTGSGIVKLRDELSKLVLAAAKKDIRIPFRLPIDRVFSVDGFGTVVTGTLIEGFIHEDDTIEVAPSGLGAKIRNIQVHGSDVKIAYAGQRVAINLAGIKKTDIKRGNVVVKPGSVHITQMLDVKLLSLSNSRRVIKNGSLVHLYHGSNVVLSKIVLLGKDELKPGESAYAQLRLTEPLAAKNGDRFVIRFYSPLETIGGGIILDAAPKKHKHNDNAIIDSLQIKESGSGDERIMQMLSELKFALITKKQLADRLSMNEDVLEERLQDLTGSGKVLEVLPDRFMAAKTLDIAYANCRSILERYHADNPLHFGIRLAELRQKLFQSVQIAVCDAILELLIKEDKIKKVSDRYALYDFEVRFTKKQQSIREKLLKMFKDAGLDALCADEVFQKFAPNEKDNCKQVLESLISSGQLVMLSRQVIYHADTFKNIRIQVADWFAAHDTLTLAEFRGLIGISRNHAIAVLEYFDRERITKKEGDFRRLCSTAII